MKLISYDIRKIKDFPESTQIFLKKAGFIKKETKYACYTSGKFEVEYEKYYFNDCILDNIFAYKKKVFKTKSYRDKIRGINENN
jgi:hypothetical protein